MRATNAKKIDFEAFGVRSIPRPTMTVAAPAVNPVLRFQRAPLRSTKKARGRSRSHGLRRPTAPARPGVGLPGSLLDRPDVRKALLRVGGERPGPRGHVPQPGCEACLERAGARDATER